MDQLSPRCIPRLQRLALDRLAVHRLVLDPDSKRRQSRKNRLLLVEHDRYFTCPPGTCQLRAL